jgi:predicted ATP-dependent serine protease
MTKDKEFKSLGNQIVYLSEFDEEADKLATHYGVTNRYSFGTSDLDTYFRGGYGRPDGYEIVLLFGATGIGKSTFALNMLLDPLTKGQKIGLLILEDDGPDINQKMRIMLGGKDNLHKYNEQLHFTPQDVVSGEKLWGLDHLLKLIEDWFVTRELDIILLDHLQFAFESAVSIKGENEYIAQRVFVRRINYLMRKLKKTIIMVSHVNKNSAAKGMDKIVGSAGIAGSATKTIEIKQDKHDHNIMLAHFHKSRFTSTPGHDRAFSFDERGVISGIKYKTDQKQIPF